MPIPVIGAGEAGRIAALPVDRDGVVKKRLCRKGQGTDRTASLLLKLLVAGHAVLVRGEDVVEQRGSFLEAVEVNGILLAPERRGYVPRPAPVDEGPQLRQPPTARARVAAHEVAPRLPVPPPGRLHQQQVRPVILQPVLPVLGIEGEQVALRAEAVGRHLVEHGGHAQITGIGRHRAGDRSLGLDSHSPVALQRRTSFAGCVCARAALHGSQAGGRFPAHGAPARGGAGRRGAGRP